jgi:hypothetical protein
LRTWHTAALAVAIAAGLTLSAGLQSNADGTPGDPTPNCATDHEYDKIQNGMRPFRVADIVGNDGWFIDTPPPGQFARGYNKCGPGDRFVKVWFESISDLSYDKAIINP